MQIKLDQQCKIIIRETQHSISIIVRETEAQIYAAEMEILIQMLSVVPQMYYRYVLLIKTLHTLHKTSEEVSNTETQ
jgi:hypothetical protein